MTLHVYFELSRLHLFPLGSILFFWPCAWGLLMASIGGVPIPFRSMCVQTATFGLGATLVHCAACVINDIFDKDMDAQVERTKNRPLVTGRVSVLEAWVLLLTITVACISMLLLVNSQAASYAFFGGLPLNIIYPLTKRWTYWPQFWLGLAVNWGIFVAWFSVTTTPASMTPIYVMFAALICWTILYDTIYACQDRADDVKAGVKSTALLFGSRVREILVGFAVAFIALLVLAGVSNGNGIWFFVLSCGGAACHLAWQLTTWDDQSLSDNAAKFKAANTDLGCIIYAGLILDYLHKIGVL